MSKRPHLKLTTPENMEGEHVLKLQELLGKRGFVIEQDGRFGHRTQKAVFHFKNRSGLPPDGEVDEATWDALEAE